MTASYTRQPIPSAPVWAIAARKGRPWPGPITPEDVGDAIEEGADPTAVMLDVLVAVDARAAEDASLCAFVALDGGAHALGVAPRARVAALEADLARGRGDLPAGLPTLPNGWTWRWDPDDDFTVDLWRGDEHVGWVALPYAPGDEAGVGRPGRAHEWHADTATAAAALLRAVGVGGDDG